MGASNEQDIRSSFSNFGSCLGVFAPGNNIVSAAPGGGYANKRGTSQATPFVAGVAALVLEQRPNASPQEVFAAIRGAASPNVIQQAMNSPNFLLQSISVPAKGSDKANANFVSLAPAGSSKFFGRSFSFT